MSDAMEYPSFIDLVGLLPGVNARQALSAYRGEYEAVLAGEAIEQRLVRAGVTMANFAEALHDVERDGDIVTTVSPAGARLLLALHEAKWLPGGRGLEWGPASPAFRDYVDGKRGMIAMLRASERDRAERERRLDDLTAWHEDEFTFTLLNLLFARHDKPKARLLVIDGITIVKDVFAPTMVPFGHAYEWVGSDGMRRRVTHVQTTVVRD